MFFKLPLEIQFKILREYTITKDKYVLSNIKPFYNLLKCKHCWKKPLKISLKDIHLHNTHLIENFKTGVYIQEQSRNTLFVVSINYSTGTVTIKEYRCKNKKYIYDKMCTTFYPVELCNQYIQLFHKKVSEIISCSDKLSMKYILNNLYQRTDGNQIIKFDPETGILLLNDETQFKLIRCYSNKFHSSTYRIYLLHESYMLVIFFARKVIFDCLCHYLDIARTMDSQIFKYTYPFVGKNLTIIKALSCKKNFTCFSHVKMNYQPKSNDIQCSFEQKYTYAPDITATTLCNVFNF